jgi:multiple sugar transport system permease protein
MSAWHRKKAGVWSLLMIAVVCIVCVFPLFWMVLISLKTKAQTYDPTIWWFTPTLDNYKQIIKFRNIMEYVRNSAVVVMVTTAVSIVIGGLAAYGFARFSFHRKENLAFWVLSLRMLPAIATVIPFFVMAQMLNVLDTQLVLIIAYMLFNIPFTIWMMRGFFEEIPQAIEEAALIDGCSRFQVFSRILLPLALPGLVATAIFCIIHSWNEFAFALFLTSSDAHTLPTTVTLFLSVTGVVWGEMSAVGVITILPVLVFSMVVQRFMIRGLTFGAVTSN